jgi:hypothetical protein
MVSLTPQPLYSRLRIPNYSFDKSLGGSSEAEPRFDNRLARGLVIMPIVLFRSYYSILKCAKL